MIPLLASATERVGIFIAAFTIVGWLVYVVVAARQRTGDGGPAPQPEVAPNLRGGDTDEELEGRRLEKALAFALVLLVISALGPLVYWLNEPSRQAGAEVAFAEQAVQRGSVLFLPTDAPGHGAKFGCADCHGNAGQGGSAEYTITDFLGRTRQVTWAAPAIDTAALKFSDDELITILTYGRANTPMPAWGVQGGGPMNEQQITDLVAYMKSLTISPEAAQERLVEEAILQASALGIPEDDAATSGEALFRVACARCHTKGWAYGEPEVMGGGAFGPNLTNGASIRQFPDIEDMIEFIANGSEYARPYGTRGVGGDEGGGMPGFGQVLTDEQIRAIAEYVRNL